MLTINIINLKSAAAAKQQKDMIFAIGVVCGTEWATFYLGKKLD